LKTATQVGKAYDDIMKAITKAFPQAKIEGVFRFRPWLNRRRGDHRYVQRRAIRTRVDVRFWVVYSSRFLKDVAFRIVPLEKRDAAEMVHEIKGFPLLQGYRGSEPVRHRKPGKYLAQSLRIRGEDAGDQRTRPESHFRI